MSCSRDTHNPIVRTYVLPDFVPTSTNKLGYVRTGLTPPPPSPPPPSDPDVATFVPPPKEEEEEQLLHLCNERFSVPEVLFTPSTIGAWLQTSSSLPSEMANSKAKDLNSGSGARADMNQAGIAETVATCISLLPDSLQGLFWSNIVCVGGSTAFEGFADRL